MRQAPSLLLDVQLVHDPVHEGRQYERCGTDEQQAGEQGIPGGKEFPRVARNWVNGPHASKNHGRIHQSVDPWQAPKIVIPEHADSQGYAQKHCRYAQIKNDSPEEATAGQKWVGAVLKHAEYRIASAGLARHGGAA
jgi:hypothetical protein